MIKITNEISSRLISPLQNSLYDKRSVNQHLESSIFSLPRSKLQNIPFLIPQLTENTGLVWQGVGISSYIDKKSFLKKKQTGQNSRVDTSAAGDICHRSYVWQKSRKSNHVFNNAGQLVL